VQENNRKRSGIGCKDRMVLEVTNHMRNSTVPAVVLSKETRFWVLVYKADVVLRKSH
jgi:hypothetical protein